MHWVLAATEKKMEVVSLICLQAGQILEFGHPDFSNNSPSKHNFENEL
jgi:hypothetical protein